MTITKEQDYQKKEKTPLKNNPIDNFLINTEFKKKKEAPDKLAPLIHAIPIHISFFPNIMSSFTSTYFSCPILRSKLLTKESPSVVCLSGIVL